MNPNTEKTLQRCRRDTTCDQQFIAKVNNLCVTDGPNVLKTLFKQLGGVDIPLDKVEEHWEQALLHRSNLQKQLNREVHLTTVLSDYLQSKTHLLTNPCLVETAQYENIIHETIHDKLTGLFNRPYFDEAYSQQISLARRYQDDFTVLFLDIDNFKDINDTYGHLAGDETLRQIGAAILVEKRDSDIAVRYGGEEFVLLMTHADNVSAFIFAERLRKKVEKLTIDYKGQQFSVTISGGIASFPFNTQEPHNLLRMADHAVYLSKGAGKNRISHFKEEKRRYLRVKINHPVLAKELTFHNSQTFTGTSKDICVGGILFENEEPLPLGALIKVRVPVTNGAPVILIGHIVRVEAFDDGRYDIGMTTSFKEMDKILNNEIAGILHSNTPPETSQNH